jgi:hypothetical protein
MTGDGKIRRKQQKTEGEQDRYMVRNREGKTESKNYRRW